MKIDAAEDELKSSAVLCPRIFLVASVALFLGLCANEGLAAEQEFRLEKADAQSVALAGEFNQWHGQQMSKQPDGSWNISLTLSPGSYGYKFLVNGSDWLFDPANPKRKTVNGIENSAVEVSAPNNDSPGPSSPPPPSNFGINNPLASPEPPPALAPTPGEILLTEAKLSKANRAFAAREGSGALTTTRIALVVPSGFDPTKSWPILVINNTENYNNADSLNEFKDSAAAAGWIALAGDAIDSEKDAHGNWRSPCAVGALDYLALVWPGANKWPVACGGMSGGAKNSAFVAGDVAKAGHPLIGLLMMGCNQDMATREWRKGSPPQFLGVPIFLSSGKEDTIATPAESEAVRDSMKRTGFSKVRLEGHDGAHVVSQPHVTEALQWFTSTGGATPTPSSFDTFFKKR